MRIEAFIIHLERAKQRQRQVDKLQHDLPMPVHVINAVDGQALEGNELKAFYHPKLHRPRYPFSLRLGEVACFLSHRVAWREIVDRDLDAGLIIEDDVDVDIELFKRILTLDESVFEGRDYLRFPQKTNEKGGAIANEGGMAIFQPVVPGLGMVMQLVGRDAAATLLAKTEQFDRPVDTTIQLRLQDEIRILSSRPVCVSEISAQMGGSIIQKKSKGLSEVISREVKRTIYRAKVRGRVRSCG